MQVTTKRFGACTKQHLIFFFSPVFYSFLVRFSLHTLHQEQAYSHQLNAERKLIFTSCCYLSLSSKRKSPNLCLSWSTGKLQDKTEKGEQPLILNINTNTNTNTNNTYIPLCVYSNAIRKIFPLTCTQVTPTAAATYSALTQYFGYSCLTIISNTHTEANISILLLHRLRFVYC